MAAKKKKTHSGAQSQKYTFAGLIVSTPFGLLLGALIGSLLVGLIIAGALGLSIGYALDDHR